MQTAKIEMVTPDMAKYYLGFNRVNRPLRPTVVKHYCKVITDGEWKLTHEGLAFGEDGRLLDGQHRLNAIVAAGIAQEMQVTRGVSNDAYLCMNSGVNRTLSDRTHVVRKEAEVYAALVRLFLKNRKTEPYMLLDVKKNIGDVTERLLEFAPSCRKYFASSSSRLCAVIRMLEPTNIPYILDLYRKLCTSDLEQLPPVGKAITRQFLSGRLNSNDVDDTISRMWVVFDRKNMNISKIQVSNSGRCAAEVLTDLYAAKFGYPSWGIAV